MPTLAELLLALPLGIVQCLSLVLVQCPIRFHNAHAFADFHTKRKFTRGELILTTIGLTLWGMSLLFLAVLAGVILRTG